MQRLETMTWAYRTISDSGLDSAVRKPPFIAINLLNKITRMNKEGKKAQRAGRAWEGREASGGWAQEEPRSGDRPGFQPAVDHHPCHDRPHLCGATGATKRGPRGREGDLEWSVVCCQVHNGREFVPIVINEGMARAPAAWQLSGALAPAAQLSSAAP